MIRIITRDQEQFLESLILSRQQSNADVESKVTEILSNVKQNGDSALFEYSKRFDKFKLSAKNLKISKTEIRKAYFSADKSFISALKKSKKNIELFAKKQKPKPWKIKLNKGMVFGEIIKPIDSVGIYVPAGKYPLVSSVLMNSIPAKIAGVKRIVMCVPPSSKKEILVAAYLCGITEIYRIGGAQAIAALAFGTQSIEKVDKIVGPGNIYVSTAKKLVYGSVGIDFIAGPTEIMVLADKGRPDFIAADLLAQAEHDENASAILLTANRALAEKVKSEISKQLQELSTKEIASKSILRNGAIILVEDKNQAIALANKFSPEHLEIFGSRNIISKVKNAGAIFIDEYSCETFGDYCSGTNHVLPTNQAAKYRAGLSTEDFVKKISFQKVSKKASKELAKISAKLAEIEGLEGHKKAALLRLKKSR
ncbi:MAG: histidinol dehydrogenase [archaeon]